MDEILDFNSIDVDKIFLKRTNRVFTKPLYFGKTIRIMTPEMNCAFGIEQEYTLVYRQMWGAPGVFTLIFTQKR